jgi:ABC-2 type transport system ATP-binding protein
MTTTDDRSCDPDPRRGQFSAVAGGQPSAGVGWIYAKRPYRQRHTQRRIANEELRHKKECTQEIESGGAMTVATRPRIEEGSFPPSLPIVEIEHLRKTYGSTVAVADVSFSVNEGEIFGVLGPNGAGKTTIVECISGLRTPDAGTIRVLGVDPQRDRESVRQWVGVQLQEGTLRPKLTVGELVDLFASFYERPADVHELLEMLGLNEKRHDYYKRLSGGQQQRLSIALALVGNPRIAILDELTTGLDPQARRDTWELIERVRDRGVSVLLVTHFMDEAERLCDRVAVIDDGRVIALDSPTGLAAREGGGSHLRFRPSRPFDDHLLSTLTEVTQIQHEGPRVVVSGTGDLLNRVVHAMSAEGIEVLDAQLESATLEDAYLRLTKREPRVWDGGDSR